MLDALLSSSQNPHRISLRVNIATTFSVLSLLISGIITWYNYRQNTVAALAMADQLLTEASSSAIRDLEAMVKPAESLADLAPFLPAIGQRPEGATHPTSPLLMQALTRSEYLYSLYAGYSDGDFYQVISIQPDDETLRSTLKAPPETRFATRSITRDDGTRVEHWTFVNKDMQVIAGRREPTTTYDPRTRAWYREAIASDTRIASSVYVFQSSRASGVTLARRLDQGAGVFGVDVTLSALSKLLERHPVSPNARALLLDRSQQVIAFQDPDRGFVSDNDQEVDVRPTRLSELGELSLTALIGEFRPGVRIERKTKFSAGGVDYIGTLVPIDAAIVAGGMVAMAAPISDFTSTLETTRLQSLTFTLAMIALSLPLIVIVAGRMSASLARLARETEAIERFELDAPVVVRSRITEIGELADAVAKMKSVLRTFGRYVPRDLVRRVVESGTPPEIGGRRQEVTLMFTDVAGYTTLAETIAPEELMTRTSHYFEEVSAAISAHGGAIDKYIGDGVMAMWNAPTADPDHAGHACRAALVCRDRVAAFNRRHAARGLEPMHTRIGLHTGEAIVGNVGSTDRINYTAIGATVNLAARIEGLNKNYGTTILVSDAVADRVADRFVFRRLGAVLPVGTHIPVIVCELMAATEAEALLAPELPVADAGMMALVRRWEVAKESWRKRDWTEAARLFAELARDDPSDRAAATFADRSESFSREPPGPEWDGVTVFRTK